MRSRHLMLASLFALLLMGGCLQAAEVIPAHIIEIRNSGDIVLGVPSTAGLFGAKGEVYYTVVADGASREIVPASFSVVEVLDLTRILARVDRQSGQLQPSYSARITPAASAVPPPVPAPPPVTAPPTPAGAPATTVASASAAPAAPPPAPATQSIPAAKVMTVEEFLADMVLISEAAAEIGVNPKDCKYWNETPSHRVPVEPFYLAKHEVTVRQYNEFLKATGRPAPSHWKDGRPPKDSDRLPVVNVTYEDAVEYCEWALKRLPAETEWEWAGRCGVYKYYPWGDQYYTRYSNIEEMDLDGPVPVGDMPRDLSRFGIFDLAGNVSEWTSSKYEPYPGNTHPEPEYDQKLRVVRGGSFSVEHKYSRLIFRMAVEDDYKACDLGFRTAISVKELDELVRRGILRAN